MPLTPRKKRHFWFEESIVGQIVKMFGETWVSKEKIKSGHQSAVWLHEPCHLDGPQRFKTGDKIGSGPQMGRLATSPLPPRAPRRLRGGEKFTKCQQVSVLATNALQSTRSPILHIRGQSGNWPTNRLIGYITLRFGGPQRFKVGKKIKRGQQVGGLPT